MNHNLLKYYQDVLGIRFLPQAILKSEVADKAELVPSFWRKGKDNNLDMISDIDCDLLFVSEIQSKQDLSIFDSSPWTLFEKMKNAMGLPEIGTVVLEYVGTSTHDLFHDLLQMKLKYLVLFKTSPERSDLKNCPEFQFIETHSPQTLSQYPQLKKDAWDDLQKIMKVIKN